MTITHIIITSLCTVLAGAMAAFLTYKLGNRKQNESDFSSIVTEYKDLVTEYKRDVEKLRREVKILTKLINDRDTEITSLRNQLMIFESSHSDVPVPIWLKDTNGIMLFVNAEYEDALLQPVNKSAEDYIGKTDVDVWGLEIGNKFREHDRRVMRQKRPVEINEMWHGAGGHFYIGRVIKYPRFLNKTVIGIGGIVVDMWKASKEEIRDYNK